MLKPVTAWGMNVLGWQILKYGDYCLEMPSLSDEEKELIAATEERFREVARSKAEEQGEAVIEKILPEVAEGRGIFLGREQQDYLCRVAVNHIYGLGFLEELLDNGEIEEISVIGPKKPVYAYFRRNGWKQVNVCFDDEKAVMDMINRLARPLGRRITLQNPRIDAALSDGSRLHGSLPPVSQGEITIRKFRDRPYSPKELSENNTLSAEEVAWLSVIMQCDCSVIIAGNTASGKTTTMNALFSFVPFDERVLIAEETPEINIPHKHQLRVVANKEMGITLKDLVYDSLRMRPDRMIVGEIRNKEEAEALMDVLLAGQARGSYATLHAQSAKEALSRLRGFGISEIDLESIDCIIVQRRMLAYDSRKKQNREYRRVIEISEGSKIIFKDGKKANDSVLLEKAADSFGLSKNEMQEELKERKKLIAKAPAEHLEFYNEIQRRLFGGI